MWVSRIVNLLRNHARSNYYQEPSSERFRRESTCQYGRHTPQ